MMEISSEFCELRASALLLPLRLSLRTLLVVVIEILADFIVLRLNVQKILLPGIEVMLVLATVESSVAVERRIRI